MSWEKDVRQGDSKSLGEGIRNALYLDCGSGFMAL